MQHSSLYCLNLSSQILIYSTQSLYLKKKKIWFITPICQSSNYSNHILMWLQMNTRTLWKSRLQCFTAPSAERGWKVSQRLLRLKQKHLIAVKMWMVKLKLLMTMKMRILLVPKLNARKQIWIGQKGPIHRGLQMLCESFKITLGRRGTIFIFSISRSISFLNNPKFSKVIARA